MINCILALKRLSFQRGFIPPLEDDIIDPTSLDRGHTQISPVRTHQTTPTSPDRDINFRSRRSQENTMRSAEMRVLNWIENICGKQNINSNSNIGHLVKDGSILCKLINHLKPGLISRINESDIPYKQTENINNFFRACAFLGMREEDLFTIGDIKEENRDKIVHCITEFGKCIEKSVPEYKGVKLNYLNQTTNISEDERQARNYIMTMTDILLEDDIPLPVQIQDGVVLCELINIVSPGTILKIEDSRRKIDTFKHKENIQRFLKACKTIGVPDHEIFRTNSLHETKVILINIYVT